LINSVAAVVTVCATTGHAAQDAGDDVAGTEASAK
jgi:hypothetical protein